MSLKFEILNLIVNSSVYLNEISADDSCLEAVNQCIILKKQTGPRSFNDLGPVRESGGPVPPESHHLWAFWSPFGPHWSLKVVRI